MLPHLSTQTDSLISVEVAILFEQGIVRHVRERQHYGFIREEVHPNGTIFYYHVAQWSEIRGWVLGWADSATVLSPLSFRDNLRQVVQKLAPRY